MSRESAAHAPGSEISDRVGGVRQRERMGQGSPVPGEAGNFGVGPIPGTGAKPMTSMETMSKTLSDKERGCPPGIPRGAGKMHATADSDHGPHKHYEP